MLSLQSVYKSYKIMPNKLWTTIILWILLFRLGTEK